MAEEPYANIREVLGILLQQRVIEITQHDPEDWAASRDSFICLHFENGVTLRIPVGDEGIHLENLPDEPESPPVSPTPRT